MEENHVPDTMMQEDMPASPDAPASPDVPDEPGVPDKPGVPAAPPDPENPALIDLEKAFRVTVIGALLFCLAALFIIMRTRIG